MRNSQRKSRSRLLGASLGAGALAAAVLAAPQAAMAAALADMTGGGPAGSTAYATVATMANTVTTIGATFNTTSTCNATYPTTFTASLVASPSTAKLSSTTVSFVVPSTLTLTGGNPTTYYVCLYNGTSGTTALLNADPTPFVLTPVASATPLSGPSGGGNTITVSAPTGNTTLFAGTSTPYVAFAGGSTGCGQTSDDTLPLNIPTNASDNVKVSDTQMKVTVPPIIGGVAATTFPICVYTASSAGTLLATAGTYSTNPPAPVSLNTSVGPVSSTVTVTGPTGFLTGITPVGQVRSTSGGTSATRPCTPTYRTAATLNPADATSVRKISNNKVAFTLPATATIADGPNYNLCLYSSNSTTTGSEGKLLAATQFTVATTPVVTMVSPVSGSPLGGSMITVTGTGLPTSTSSISSATLGGMPLQNITPISPTTFTAVVPPNSLGSKTLSITTASGVASLTGAYNYVNSISVAPNTAPNTATAVDLDVTGSGFVDLNFNDTANTDAHVFLVDGKWRANGAGTTRDNANAVADCLSVLVINDTELICTVNLTRALLPDGTLATVANGYRAIVATNAVTAASSNILTMTDGLFSKADIGKAIGEYTLASGGSQVTTAIPAGTTIVNVLSASKVVLSANAGAAVTAANTIRIGTQRSALTVAAASGETVLTGAAGTFSSSDVGYYVVSGGGIAADTYITGVNDAGTMAVLSKATSATVTTAGIQTSNAVPSGAYNVVVVSDADPDNGSTSNVYSSGSTFTVASF
jgi:IPT/TIG domain-containing protein